MTSSPGRTGSAHTVARYHDPGAGRHSPSGYCQCHWQHHDAGVKPLASGPARRAEYPRAAASAGGVRAGGPWPRASQHWAAAVAVLPHCTPDLAGAQVQVVARARALQPPANLSAHGAAVTVPCSPTRSRARATRPPAGLTAAPQSPGPLRPSPDARGTGANWQWPASGRAGVPGRARGPSRRRGTACGQTCQWPRGVQVGSRLQAACVPSADERAGLLLPSPSAPA